MNIDELQQKFNEMRKKKWWTVGGKEPVEIAGFIRYGDDDCRIVVAYHRSGIFIDAETMRMPKWAARIHLRITMVRLQRLQKISFEDAKNEGVEFWRSTETLKGLPACACHYYEFEDLWAHINGRDSWNLNPLVWAVDFEAVK